MYRKTLLVLSLVAAGEACTSPTQQSNLVRPGGPFVASLAITGPANVAPGQTVTYTATAKMTDGSTADYTQKVAWIASPATVLTISSNGQATAQAAGEATVRATASPGTGFSCCIAPFSVLVLPPDTYRLVGKIIESGVPVTNASVVVVSGIGAGLSATTDVVGGYRLYGVAGLVQVKMSKAGYDDITKPFTVTQNDVLDFPEAHQTAALPALGGAYTLTLTADPGCSTTGARVLEDALRAPQQYTASVAQNGPVLTVTLTDSNAVAQESQFSGRISPDAIEFVLGDGYYGYGLDDGVAERLSSSRAITFGGDVKMQRSALTLTGTLNGPIEVYNTAAPPILVEQCLGNHQFLLARSAQPARRR
jgi:hypothetical protein